MKTLYVDGLGYKAEKIIKTSDSIIGKNGEVEVFSFRGISDFSMYQLEDGQEWDLSEKDELALYQLELDFRLSLLEMGVNTNDL